ncbi:peptidase [Roseobacter sinensis]|uniref:Peptidase n=1 Tax=Roseobacter sinensis TaxID=2931391 RepID=A0ABT3BFA7_9RHOB|nr:peptidase [Roseobacter sp. WL0113]MCV3272275.1 peptidase [Roseobacter sp. WL0113]
MTYCVGLRLDRGLVFMSDTRTNAGVDNFAKTRKMFQWGVPGERLITLMTAGNLATTQALVSMIEERVKAVGERDPSILHAPSMFQVARMVGRTLKEVIAQSAPVGPVGDGAFQATVILGGQIQGSAPTMFLVYPEGNFIEVTEETPFFQIGETKYGRPILVRAYDPAMRFEDAVKLLLVSFDSTVRSNLSVAPPFDLMVYENDGFVPLLERRIEADDAVYQSISTGWGDALRTAFDQLPDFTL